MDVPDQIVSTGMILFQMERSCKSVFENKECVVQHLVKSTAFLLCFNCEDWIKFKDEFKTKGWTLYDQNEDLKTNI